MSLDYAPVLSDSDTPRVKAWYCCDTPGCATESGAGVADERGLAMVEARTRARRDGWLINLDGTLCPGCVARDRPPRWPVGTVLQCIHDDRPGGLSHLGKLSRVEKITEHAEGPCYWLSDWHPGAGASRKKGAPPPRDGFDPHVLAPLPASMHADYQPATVPPGYQGEALLIQEAPAVTDDAPATQEPRPAPAAAPAPEPPAATYQPDQVYHLPLDQLHPDPEQPRQDFPADDLAALAADLAATGQETPITFRVATGPDGAQVLHIVHGERRWRAAALAGLPTLAAVLDRHPSAEPAADRLIRQAVHNEQHACHTPWDWATLCRRLTEAPHHLTPTAIADEFARRGIKGKSRPVVSTLISLHRLPDWAIAHLRSGLLTPTHGRLILQQADRPRILDHLRGWLADANDFYGRPDGAVPDDAPPPPPGPRGSHLADEIRHAYQHLGVDLHLGTWLKDGEFLGAHFDWQAPASDCPTCPHYGVHSNRHWCLDHQCLRAKNAALSPRVSPPPVSPPAEAAAGRHDDEARGAPATGALHARAEIAATDRLASKAGPNRDAPAPPEQPPAAPSNSRRTYQEQRDACEHAERIAAAEQTAILDTLDRLGPDHLLPILVYTLLSSEFPDDGQCPSIMHISAAIHGPRASGWLAETLRDLLSRFPTDAELRAIGDYLRAHQLMDA